MTPVRDLLLVHLNVLQEQVQFREHASTRGLDALVHLFPLVVLHVGLQLEVGLAAGLAVGTGVLRLLHHHDPGPRLLHRVLPILFLTLVQAVVMITGVIVVVHFPRSIVLLPTAADGQGVSQSVGPDFMGLHVLLDVGLLSKGPPTDDTLERLLTRMASDVLLQVKVFVETAITEGTL